jgi:hypothetical protein
VDGKPQLVPRNSALGRRKAAGPPPCPRTFSPASSMPAVMHLAGPAGIAIDRASAVLVADDVGNTIWRVTPEAAVSAKAVR